MIDYRRETEELNQIPIQTVGMLLGLTLPRSGSTNCPFKDHEDKNPSFVIKERPNRWICYGCGRKGGAIDLVKEYLQIDFLEAKKWLTVGSGKCRSVQKSCEKPSPSNSTHPDTQTFKPEEQPDVELYEKFHELRPLQTNAQAYLAQRGITEKTIKAFRISQLSRQRPVLMKLLSDFGFERLKKSGVLTKQSTPQHCRLVFAQGSIIFPFIESGRIVYLQARKIGEVSNGRKWMNLNGRRHRIFNIDILTKDDIGAVAICEGVMDTLSAIELGFNAIGLMGVSAKIDVDDIKRLKNKNVDILLDWDERGCARAEKLQYELNRYGVVSIRKMRPSSNATDLNEYLMITRGFKMTPYERLLLPENLVYAWRKALRLYKMEDGYMDRAELAAFELNLEQELASINAQFRNGKYKLRKIRPLPRPKKIDDDGMPVNRQYFHVSVRDQVAWIAVANALGPQLDRRMPSWSYGHRLFRPAWYEDDNGPASNLEIGPYRHASGHLYRKFQHSWPLFRRQIALTAKNMAREIKPEDIDDKAEQWALATAEKEELPYTQTDFWKRPKEDINDLYHASIDLKQFYPNINSESILKTFFEFLPELNSESPFGTLLKSMLRFSLDKADMQEEILKATEPQFQKKVQGIPTGLFVAGFLSNVAMLTIDHKVNERILEKRNVAHFRFVDDHALIAYDFDALCDWIEWYKKSLIDLNVGPEINEKKYDPESIATWLTSKERKHRNNSGKEEPARSEAERDSKIDGRIPTKLLTKTLGQVSAIVATNVDILADKDIEDRLTQLEWLLLADIPEREIRSDTRAAFAAGQIAKIAPLLVQDTNGLIDEVRKLARLEEIEPEPSDQSAMEKHKDQIAAQKQRVKDCQKEHDATEKKRIRHCFELLLQAFEEFPNKSRLFYRLLQYCRQTGHMGLERIAEWINNERVRNRYYWADYFSGLTLHILSRSLLNAAKELNNKGALWSDRDAAMHHIKDISKLDHKIFSVPLSRLTWFQKQAQIEFSVSAISVAAFLNDTDFDKAQLELLKIVGQKFACISFEAKSPLWVNITGSVAGVWAHFVESTLESEGKPSSIWHEFEKCFNYSLILDQNAARRYPAILSDRAWSAVLDSSLALKEADSGWLCEVLEGSMQRLQQAKQSNKRVFRRVIRASEAKSQSYLRASEWVLFTKSVNHTDPFDPRPSEWTALEIIRLLLEPARELRADSSSLDLIHPNNVLIPEKWRSEFSPKLSMSWVRWRNFVKVTENKDVQVISKNKAIYDYRYSKNEKNLTATSIWESQLHNIGHFLWGLLKNEYSMPPMWNLRGNECAKTFPFGSSFSTLAISNQTLRILEGCLGKRSAENRVILVNPSLFGWEEGEEPNDADLDPPRLSNLNELYSLIEKAQRKLEHNQIAVSMNKPRQLIPVKLEGIAVSHIGSQDGDGDVE